MANETAAGTLTAEESAAKAAEEAAVKKAEEAAAKAAEKAAKAAAKKVAATAEEAAQADAEAAQAAADQDMVTVRLPKTRDLNADVFVSVNGRRFQIQRGVNVEIPAYVAAVLEYSEKQDQETMERLEALVSKGG